MLKDLASKYYHEQKYNCAEAVLRAGNDYYGLGLPEQALRMVGGFGGGLMTGNTCGTVLSGVSILAMKYVETKAWESSDIQPVTVKLIRSFRARYGSVLCKEIKPQSFAPEYRCGKTVENACEIMEQVIAEYEKERQENNLEIRA